jgi:predicted ester cyclase
LDDHFGKQFLHAFAKSGGVLDFQQEKQAVLGFYRDLDVATPDAVSDVIARHCTADLIWRGYHPFNEISGPEPVAELFWAPLKTALTSLQRRMDIFMAGTNTLGDDGGVWVVSMGHLMGLFDGPWLGIAPTGKMAFLRYCAFHKVERGRITQEAMFFDIPHLMLQAGLSPFASQTAAQLVQPGPQTHDGLLFAAQPGDDGAKTMQAIEAMIGDLGTWQLGLPLEEELARSWHQDMIWWGPAGIGATYTIERYAKQHAGPFRAAFSERSATGHICRMSEGHFGGFFGWPNFSARLTGDFMGFPPTGARGDMRVIDIYRRRGSILAENWVFIDLLHFWKQQGRDILAQTTGYIAP